eukprot:GHUV01025915.1.p1 GENE.GHUV01025915.1~~GHUV01025915.1.p1  ORF type:complete len:172 (+),score=20.45 GHUV01025915.1:346-861(+)
MRAFLTLMFADNRQRHHWYRSRQDGLPATGCMHCRMGLPCQYWYDSGQPQHSLKQLTLCPLLSLYCLQIVANGINGIDVDKIDYLQRDARMTGVRCSYDFTSLLLRDCKVIDGTICFPDSKQTFVADLYNARWSMHRDVYQHRKSKAAEYMVVDILKAADPVLGISSRIHR